MGCWGFPRECCSRSKTSPCARWGHGRSKLFCWAVEFVAFVAPSMVQSQFQTYQRKDQKCYTWTLWTVKICMLDAICYKHHAIRSTLIKTVYCSLLCILSPYAVDSALTVKSNMCNRQMSIAQDWESPKLVVFLILSSSWQIETVWFSASFNAFGKGFRSHTVPGFVSCFFPSGRTTILVFLCSRYLKKKSKSSHTG